MAKRHNRSDRQGIELAPPTFADRVRSRWANFFGYRRYSGLSGPTGMGRETLAIHQDTRIIGVGGSNDLARYAYNAGLITYSPWRRGKHLSDAGLVFTVGASMDHDF